VYVLPAMRWYFELLRPVLEHARDVGPLGFVWECFLDTKAANLSMLRKVLGREQVDEALGDGLAGEAERQAAQAIEDASTATREAEAGYTAAVGVAAGVLALFGPAGQAAGGVLAAGAAIGAAMTAALQALGGVAEGTAYTDPLGRLWPPYELLRLSDALTVEGVRPVMPAPPPGFREGSSAAAQATASVTAPPSTLAVRVPWAKLPTADAPVSLTVTSDVAGLRFSVAGPGLTAEEKLTPPWKGEGLRPGLYTIRASAPGRATVTREVSLLGGAVYREHFASTDLALVTRAETPAPRPSGGSSAWTAWLALAAAVGWWLIRESERE